MEFLQNKLGGNRDVIALSVGRLGDAIGNSLIFIIVPLYIAQLPAPAVGLSPELRTGILISLFGFVSFLTQPFAGMVVDRLNRRKIFVLIGLMLMVIGTGSYVLTSTYSQLVIVRVIQGIGAGITIPATVAILTNASERRTRGGSMGIFSTSRVLGLAIGPLLGGFLYSRYGFDVSFYVGSGFVLLGVIAVQLWVHDVRAPEGDRDPGEAQPAILDPKLLTAPILALSFATFVMANSFAMITPLETEFNQRLNQGSVAFSAAFSALMIARIVTQIPLGRLTDLRGRKRLILYGLALMAVATAPMGLVRTLWQLVLLRALQGLASAGIAAPAFALAGDLARSGSEGRQMSIVTMGLGLGISTGTLLAGALGAYWIEWPFVLTGVLALASVVVVQLYASETVGQESE
jgi:MFS family permease